MTDTLYGLTASDISTDAAGNVLAGRSATVYNAPYAGEVFTQTKAVNEDFSAGVNTGGVIPTDATGRLAFFAVDFTGTLWLEWNAGSRRWPINPTKLDDVVQPRIDEVGASLTAQISDAVSAANSAAAQAKLDARFNVANYATAAQIAGTADATSAWQAAVDAARAVGGGRIISPPDATWWFDGSAMVMLSTAVDGPVHDIVFDGQGCQMFKTTQDGNYVIFLDRYSSAGLGYGSGANRLTFQNFNVRGSFNDSTTLASVNLFTGNHSRDIRVLDCTFTATQLQSSHTFDLGGVDGFYIERCTWYGYHNDGVSAPRSECVNTDISLNGSGAAVSGYADGLATKNVHMKECKFLPWTDPATGTKYPAPIPIGAHSGSESSPFENINVDDVFVLDPPKDASTTGVGVDDPYLRGLVHYPAVRGLRVRNLRVVASDGLGCLRVVQVQSTSEGNVAGSADSPVVGAYATPQDAKDIDLDVTVEGFAGTDSSFNPLVYVGGLTTSKLTNVHVKMKARKLFKEAVYLWNVERAIVDVEVEGGTQAARVVNSDKVTVRGAATNTQLGVGVGGSTRVAVGPFVAHNATTQPYLIGTATGTDYITAANVVATGYTALYQSTPTHHAEAATIVSP